MDNYFDNDILVQYTLLFYQRIKYRYRCIKNKDKYYE